MKPSSSLSGIQGLEARARELVDELIGANELSLATEGDALLAELVELKDKPAGSNGRATIVGRIFDWSRQAMDKLIDEGKFK